MDAPDVAHIHAPHANARHQFTRRAGAQAIRLIAADIKPRKRHQRADLRIQIIEQCVSPFAHGGEHIGRFTQRGVLGLAQNAAEVAERLLIAEHIEVEGLHVSNQGRQFLRGERAVGGADLRVLLERELILHVVGHEVELEIGGEGGLELQGVQRRAGAAGQVILKATPAQRRPVAYLQTGKRVPLAIGPDQLAERLQATEQPRGVLCRADDLISADLQRVALGRGLLRQSGQEESPFLCSQAEGGDGRLEPGDSRSAEASPLQLGIQKLRRQLSLVVGDFKGQ